MTRKFTFLILAMLFAILGPGAKAWGQSYEELFTIKSSDVVSNSGYANYEQTIDGRGWIITFGGNNKSVGTNSGNRSKCNLNDYSKYAVTPVTTSDVASAFVSTTEIVDVSKISYTFNGGSNQTNTNVYLIYSSDGNTFSQVSLTSGTQGAAISSGTAYEFTKCSGYFGLLFKATNSSGNWRIDDVEIKFYEGGDTPTLELISIAVSGTPTKTEYETDEEFDPAGLVVTGTYDDASTADLTDDAEWTFDPATFTSTSQTSVSVTATVDGKSDTKNYSVTVTEHVITPGEYEIALNNALYGISTGNNGTEQNTTVNDITIISGCLNSASSKTYYDAGHIRYYADSYLKLSVPEGYLITEIVFTADGTWNGSITSTPNTYTADTKTWTGSSRTVDFAFAAQNRASKITVTFITNKTVESIAVKTDPVKTTYYEGETFDPAGLVITATYDDESAKDIAYADHANDFTFIPDLTTALTTTNKSVTITYGGKTVNQTITVAEAPKYDVSYYSLGILLTEEQVSRGETCNAPSVTTPEGWDFVGWTENGEYLYNTTAPELFNTLAPIEATHSLHAVFSKLVGNFENKNASVSIEDYALANDWENNGKYLTVNVDENISVNATAKGTTGQYNSAAQDWRMYQTSQNYSQWKINATNNSTLNSVIFTYSSSNNGIISYEGNTYASVSTIALSGNESSTFTVGNTGTADNGQVRITNISIAYTIGSGTRYYAINRVIDAETTISEPTTWEGKTEVYGTITVNSILTADEIINSTASNLVIEDGAQLIHHNAGVNATVKKSITGYTGDNDNYYLIANPTDNTTVANLINPEGYDLYTFNPAQALEWHYEKESNKLTSGIGYLYANKATTTLEFVGALTPAGSSYIELTYANAGTGIDFPGFNLIGNPYTCNVYLNKDAYVLNGDDFVSIDAGTAIAPCQGFFVEATQVDKSVTLSTTAPVTAPNALNIAVSQNRGNVIDRAIVNFNGSNNLHKFMMNPAHTNLSIAKGGETFAAISTEAEGELPVNFKAEKNGTYTITVNTKNVDAEYLHLIDNMTGMDVDLLSTPSYTFEAKTSDYASRFKLVFGVKNEASESSDSSFAFMSDGNLVIDNIEGEATLQIVDELGRVISTETVSGSYNKALNLKAGLYIINLNGMTQKIVVK